MRFSVLCVALVSALALEVSGAGFVAFNDFAPGYTTHSNATGYGPTQQGLLKDIQTGARLGVAVKVTGSGVVSNAVQGRPLYGTPASVVFDGFVDFGGRPSPSLEMDVATDSVTYTFSGLDPALEYNFQGTAIRGHWSYTNRWSLFSIEGTASFTSRHTPGALTRARVAALTESQVLINTGDNNRGDMAWWEHIHPAADGTFSVVSKKYTGSIPGGSSGGSVGYAITGFRLEQGGVYSGRDHLPPQIPNPQGSGINGVNTVFVVLMENHDWSTILGSSFCPYINGTMLPKASYADRYMGVLDLHPSEPNYLWLVTGTNFNIRNDDLPSLNRQSSTNTLFHQLDAAGISWKSYQEDITGTKVPDTNSGEYVARHNPPVFFDSIRTNVAYALSHIRPYSELAVDLSNNVAPRFCFISPNLTNIMHDTAPGSPSSRKQGDEWLARELPHILQSAAYTNGGALFLTWDEGSNDGDAPIGMIVMSPRAKGGGYHNTIPYTHSSWLRTVQDIFGLQPYLGDAAFATSLSDLFKTLRITGIVPGQDGLEITAANLIPGRTNILQSTLDVGTGGWTAIQTNVATAATQKFLDPVDLGAAPRFYRLIELP
jgi:hypothetical protein